MICKGCGAELQFSDRNKQGYIDEEVYKRRIAIGKEIRCERCFRLIHYNDDIRFESEEDFLKLVKEKIKPGMPICHVVDAFDLAGTLFYGVNAIFPDNPVILISGKYDLFRRACRPKKIIDYLNVQLSKAGIKVLAIIVTTEKKGGKRLYEKLLKLTEEYRLQKNFFFIGRSNVGKTALVNSLRRSIGDEEEPATVSSSPSTTIGITSYSVGELTITDTPGIVGKKRLADYLSKKTIDFITPRKFVRPTVYQLRPGQTVFIGGFAAISYLGRDNSSKETSEKLSLVFYFGENIKLHRTKYENSKEYYQRHKNDFRYPQAGERKKLGEIVTVPFNMEKGKELVLGGIGFIGFNGGGKGEIKTFSRLTVTMRDKLI